MLLRLESLMPHAEKINPRISRREVGWHLEHSLKIICSIGKALVNSKPEDYSSKFNIAKYYVFGARAYLEAGVAHQNHSTINKR